MGSGYGDYKDRFFGAAVYLFALYDAVVLGAALLTIPALRPLFQLIQVLLLPISTLYGLIPLGLGSLIVFFALYLAVVQNNNISFFIRFSAMQSILLGIALSLIQIILQTLPALALVGSVISLVAIGVCFYCMVQCLLGRRPEIPSFSNFVYNFISR